MGLRSTAMAIAPAFALATLVLLAATLVTVGSTSAQSTTTPTCSTGTAVPDASNNPGLVSDCEALLASRDTQTLAAPTVLQGVNNVDSRRDGLFSDVDGEPPPSVGVDALASRLVGIDFEQLGQAMETPAGPKDPATGEPPSRQKLMFNLFDDVVFTGIVEHVEPTASGHALWGSIEGVELGTMTMVVNGSIVVGTVRTLDGVYTIRTAGDGTYVIREIDESSLPPPGEPLEPTPSRRDTSTQSDDIPPDDGSVIDVMVVYTPLAKQSEGGRAAIEALIDLFVAETNQVYANSGVIHRIRLVLREEVDYTEDGYSQLDLQRLRDASDGYMDHVHERRDLYAADLVHIVVGKSDTGGIGGFRGESAAFGFGLTASYAGGLVFAHEVGHNMGLSHDRFEAGVGVGVPLTGSNYGYVNQKAFEPDAPESARWKTIMAYNSQCGHVGGFYCPSVQYFSNPEKTYRGDPMGVPADHPSTGVDGPADAVGTLNDRRAITANFRRSSSSPTPRVGLNLSPYWLSERGGVSTVTATLHRPSSEDTTVTVSASPSDAVRLSRNGVLIIPAGETVSRGAVTITGVNNGTRTGDVSVTVSATAANSSSLGVVAPEPVELAIADDETRPVVTLSLSPPEIPEIDGRTFVSGILDNMSGVETIVTVSARPSNAVHQIYSDTLVIQPGRRVSDGFGVEIYALDDDILAEAQKSVTVSGTARNSHGVTGPESVTLTIIDDEAPYFAEDSITYSFTEGVAGGRFLPEAAYGNRELTYSLSPSSGSEVTFTPGPPAHIGVPALLQAGLEGSYTLTATDADGDSDTMTIIIGFREGVCPNSPAVAGYSELGIVNDCEALLASRDALSVERTLNWDKDLPIEKWEGVYVRGSRVVGLRIVPSVGLPIVRDGIVGTIPSELGSLSSLRTLGLWGNQLTGGIPKELGSLTNLQTLNLNENRLTGEIPKELGSLAKLQSLDLLENRLTGEIPTELGDLSELNRLSLSGNRLTGEIPAELENLPYLQGLYLRDNLLTGCVPDGLRDVQHSDLAELGLPFCVDLACSTLAEASSGTNNPGLKSDCAALLAARDVLAGTATLNWSTDTPIADWSGVVLEGTPGRVTELRLRNLGLTGEIPPELGSLSDLRHLNLSDNSLTGHIPTELGGLFNLQELYLSGNGLSGCVLDELRDIPSNDFAGLALPFCSEHPCVGGGAVADATNPGLLSDCEMLLAARDTLAGTAALNWATNIPITEWVGVILGGNLERVNSLRLFSRELTGEIPPELGNLTNLTGLSISDNQLTGKIPTELGNLVNLQALSLSGNRLTGKIPTELGNLDNLWGLWLDGNQLTGGVPKELGNLDNLWGLWLDGNQLTGGIPKELGSLDNLQTLEVSDNQLTGEIPPELGSLSNLQVLALFGNQLSGEIPTELGNLVNLRGLFISKNQLSGEIPTELGNLVNLQTLSLSGNRLNGEILTEFGNLTRLKRLYIDGNQLTGEIPTELGRLFSLSDLFLFNNDLEGSIPASLGNLRNLERLWLSGNRLTGCVPPRLRYVPDNDFDQQGLSFCALSPPDAPTIGSVTPELDSLAISWSPPLNDGGSDITAYDLRHIETSADETVDSNWTAEEDVWTTGGGDLEYTLTGLTADIQYDIQVRAVNAEGDGSWSETVTGSPTSSICVTGGAVTDATNTGLVSDCETLLDSHGILDSTATLNWSSDTPIADWDGITIQGTPERVAWLNIREDALTGSLPPELGRLSGLTYLNLRSNGLTGPVPTELGDLANLRYLGLNNNELSGPIPDLSGMTGLIQIKLQSNKLNGSIPTSFGNMTNLVYLYLHDNELTGEIPSELGDMESLRYLRLHRNMLSGAIPDTLGDLESLRFMWLHGNELSGQVPSELGSLTNLEMLWLSENNLSGQIPAELDELNSLTAWRLSDNGFTGCVPPGLAAIEDTDLASLSLEVCEDS